MHASSCNDTREPINVLVVKAGDLVLRVACIQKLLSLSLTHTLSLSLQLVHSAVDARTRVLQNVLQRS